MTDEDLKLLVDYHYWARDRVLEALEPLSLEEYTRPLGNSFPSLRDTVVHLYGADWIWCSRWEGVSPDALPDPGLFSDLAAIRAAWEAHERQVRAALERYGERGVDTLVEYVRHGKHLAEPFSQTLQHLVNHGSYHRGQVTTMLRQLGQAPPKSLDLIAFYRQRASAGV
jgi:uncharacterized damage-inducible protein DinB